MLFHFVSHQEEVNERARAASASFGSSVSLGIVPAMSYSPNAIRAAAAHSTLCMLRESRKRITAEGSLLPSRYVQLQDGREEEKRRDREKEPSKRHVTLSLARPPLPMKEGSSVAKRRFESL